MRLGFAVAIHVDPDVLLVDEVLAVGDEGFTHKCLDKFAEFRRRGKTILLVTHSLNLVERFCDEAVWIDGGRVQADGDPKRVVGAYLTAVEVGEEATLAAENARVLEAAGRGVASAATDHAAQPNDPLVALAHDVERPSATVGVEERVTTGPDGPPANMFQASEGRWGSREVEITGVSLLTSSGEPSFVFHSGDPMAVRIAVRAHQPASDFVFGVGIFNAEGVCCYGTNTYLEQMEPERLSGDAHATFAIEHLDLVEGTYKLDVAIHKRDGFPYDYHRLLYTFRVKSRLHDVGIYRPRHSWSFSTAVRFRADSNAPH
jgi:hypothetical protein